MTCRRCHGLMVVDYYIDLLNGGEDFWLRAWRPVQSAASSTGLDRPRRWIDEALGRSKPPVAAATAPPAPG